MKKLCNPCLKAAGRRVFSHPVTLSAIEKQYRYFLSFLTSIRLTQKMYGNAAYYGFIVYLCTPEQGIQQSNGA